MKLTSFTCNAIYKLRREQIRTVSEFDPGAGVQLQFRLFCSQDSNSKALFISGPVYSTSIQVRKGSG